MRKTIVIILTAAMVLSCVSCASQAAADRKDITTEILDTFNGLTQVPRPSHHEEKISEYLEKWAKVKKFEVTRDNVNNVIVEVPATKGMESKPKVALQGHMDMVFAQKDGANLDPLTTTIKSVNDGTYLRSDGNTSLGADDGIGVAIMMNIAEGKMAHGPLKLIITTCEEDGMVGTFGLDPAVLKDVDYLINLDSEEEGTMCLSTAAGVVETFTMKPVLVDYEKTTAVELSISGLRGGHSGLDIDKGRLNAIKGMTELLLALKNGGIEYGLSVMSGGSAPNAIPTSAKAVIYVSAEDKEKAQQVLNEKADEIKACHKDTDPDMQFSITPCSEASKVLSSECRDAVLGLLSGITDGLVTMSKDIEGLVESSSNLGLFSIDGAEIKGTAYMRSSSPEMLEKILADDEKVSMEQGFSYSQEKTADPWAYKPDNHLMEVADEAYRSLFGKDIEHITMHAGLECGTYSVYNPDLDMIAIGPTLYDVHTINERLEIATIEKVWRFVEKILADI